MQTALPVQPISQLQQRPTDLLNMVADGPVILAQRSKSVAVITSIENWNIIAARLAQFERAALLDERIAKDEWVTGAELDREFAALGLS